MAATSERARVAPGTISFELERFERVDGRLELSGRWFGVRGLRFVRPTLTLVLDDGSGSRALADLEHKPWAPSDGDSWEAAFPCNHDLTVLDAELAVAPGIAIPLPAPGEALPESDPISSLPASAPQSTRGRGSSPPRRIRAANQSAVPDELAALREETQRLRKEPIRLQAELDRSEQLRKHVEGELDRLKLDANGALARRNAAVDRGERVAAERDEAVRERNDAVRAKDAALAERDDAVRERDAAVRERDAANSKRDAAIAARNAASSKSEDAGSERALALAERNKGVAERAEAIRERDRAIGERDKAVRERDQAVAARKEALAERDRARSGRRATIAPRANQPARIPARTPVFSEHHDRLIKRALAMAVLFVAVLALLIVVGAL
jgi:hypothetical protein